MNESGGEVGSIPVERAHEPHGSTRSPRSRRRQVAVAAWVAYVVLLFLALFSPASSTQSHLVFELSRALSSLSVLPDGWVTYDRMEVVSNALIIAPVSLLGSVVWPQVRWRDWTAFGFLGALLVEAAQGLLLPGRQAAFSDVVANAGGAMLGAWVYLTLKWATRRASSS